jgi:nitrite reductase (NADH) large subunit
LWRDADWPAQMGVEYRSGVKATSIEPEAKRVRLANGEVLAYDKLVIATGSRLYAPVEGADLKGIYNFKSLSAAEALVKRIRSGEARTACIVGAGFIGMEIALLLRELGVAVTQVEMLDQVMSNMLDTETAAVALSLMRERGVEVRLKTRAEAFVGNGSASGVRLESGEMLQADLLIAATGVKPNLDLLEGSDIARAWGMVVDENLRTNMPDIYAAGDAIESPDRLNGKPYVHAIFPNAIEQGRVVGMNLAGYPTVYEGADRMNSLKHLGLPIMAVGEKEGDRVLRERWNGNLRTIYLREQRVVGFQLTGDIRAAGVLRTLLIQGSDVGRLEKHLLNPNFGEGMAAWSSLVG